MNALCDIPNQPHFKLTVFMKDGRQVKTKVRRNNKTHFHTLIGVRIADAKGWVTMNAIAERATMKITTEMVVEFWFAAFMVATAGAIVLLAIL